MTTAKVMLWNRCVGAVTWSPTTSLASFQYDKDFQTSHIQIAPLTMPLNNDTYAFPHLPVESFFGLPGLLMDTLPDKFGNKLIDTWLAKMGREANSFNPVERLCYIGNRGMGALEFKPHLSSEENHSSKIDLEALTSLASDILTERKNLSGSLDEKKREQTLTQILKIGTSAGGARAKAIINWNPTTHEVKSGQTQASQDFEPWLLKFDGVMGNGDKELEDAMGFGRIEYAYSLMAKSAGIQMMECRLLTENNRCHFMTKRFDRIKKEYNNSFIFIKQHALSLSAIAHYDFNQAGAYSYEQASRIMRKLNMPMATIEEQFKRMAFNIVARNHDDHVKNISFLMNQKGEWSLSPAYDITYSYNPTGAWTQQHQMTLNGKQKNFMKEDFVQFEKDFSMKKGKAFEILSNVIDAIKQWPDFAKQAGIPDAIAHKIGRTHHATLLNNNHNPNHF